jgi:Skp family chaperone for outer membrane proteins
MNPRKVAKGAAWVTLALSVAVASTAFGQTAGVTTGTTKIAIIDIERIAAESTAGKALFASLKAENDKIQEEVAKREQEIRDMSTKLNSEILSQDAKVRLQRDIERKRTEAQRWLQDQQQDFEAKRQEGEAKFQESLEPIVRAVATENQIGLILRATPGLTFVLDPALDISLLVVQKLDAAAPPSGDAAAQPKP